MTLTDEHIEILQKVREYMEKNSWNGYICTSIESVLLSRFRVDRLSDHYRAKWLHKLLTHAITDAIDGYGTVFSYLRNTVPGREEMPLHEEGDLSPLARMAWLDKMIESRTIA